MSHAEDTESIILTLSSDRRAKLDQIASRQGISPQECLYRMIDGCDPEDFEILFGESELLEMASQRIEAVLNIKT